MTRALAAGVALLLTGCGTLLPNDAVPDVDPGPQEITDCEPPFVFEGETTMAELGLAQILEIGATATRRGSVVITRDIVTHEQFAPPEAPVVVPAGQLLCLTFPDGSGVSMMLPEPFPLADEDAGDGSGPGAVPLTPILVGAAVLILAAISWLAFRREGTGSA